MRSKRKVTIEVATDSLSTQTESIAKTSSHPNVLKGNPMPSFILPTNFDVSVHQQLRASGDVKPVTRAELAARIQALAKKKTQLG